MIKASLNEAQDKLVVIQVQLQHNPPICPSAYPENRRLNADHIERAQDLISLGVKAKVIWKDLRAKSGD